MSQISKGDLVEVVGTCCGQQDNCKGVVSNVREVINLRTGEYVCECGAPCPGGPAAFIKVPCDEPGHNHLIDSIWPCAWLRKIEPPKQTTKTDKHEPITTGGDHGTSDKELTQSYV